MHKTQTVLIKPHKPPNNNLFQKGLKKKVQKRKGKWSRNPDSLGLSEDSDDLGVQICDDVHVTSVGARVPVTQSNKSHTQYRVFLLCSPTTRNLVTC